MTTEEKIRLSELLGMYATEKAQDNVARKTGKYGDVIPTKSLYTHARVLMTKLAVEIERELKSIYER